jgi:signal transduction histidine kinase
VSGDLISREMKWPVLGALAAFVVAGALTYGEREVWVSLGGAVLAVAAAMIMQRRAGREALLAAVIAAAGVALASGSHANDVGWFGLCVLTFGVMLRTGPRLGVAFTLGAMALVAGEWIWGQSDTGWAPWIAGVAVSAVAAALIARDRRLLSELQAAQAGLAERERAEERNRIARELHDVIAHSLTVSLLHIASARLAVESEPDGAAEALAEAERLGRESLEEVRSIVGVLRADGGPAGTAPVPDAGALQLLVERFRSAGAAVTLSLDGELERVPATSGATLYRILQEALTNAAKHAPGTVVDVAVRIGAANVELCVDSGGAPGSGRGMGLDTMRERAQAVGGRCEVGPQGSGWRVLAVLPLRPTAVAGRR